MEVVVAAHLVAFVVGVSWAFGGNASWVRTPVSIWGTVGILLTIVAVATRRSRDARFPGTIRWIWPVLALDGIILVSCLTPGFRQLDYPGGSYMMPVRVAWWIPSTARTAVALRALWLFNGIYFSCLNAALVFARRKTIRVVLAAVVANAVVLSIFGTVQKLVGAKGIYFGLVKSPQDDFFASFVYDNHWGAFIVLMTSACIGLVLRYASGSSGRGFFHGPALMGLVVAALLVLSVPMSGSRACTMILGVLACVAGIRGTSVVSRALRVSGVAPAGAFLGMAVAAILAVAGVWMVAGDVIEARAAKTKDQVAAMWAQGGLGSRSVLYKDTMRMAKQRILFGWGMGSYPSVFSLYNSQESKIDHLPVIYHDAHSDWLQSAAEIGLVGTALIGVSVLQPMLATRRQRVTFLPYFLLTGCVLVAAYAWVEFPFGNVAVVLAWWLSFFLAVQYVRLTGPPGAKVRAD